MHINHLISFAGHIFQYSNSCNIVSFFHFWSIFKNQIELLMRHTFSKVLRNLFSTEKYFKDTIYKNLRIVADDKLDSLHILTGVFCKYKIDLSYIRTFQQDFKPDLKKQYTLNISIYDDLPRQKLDSLFQDLRKIGCHTTVQQPIEVPWFPRYHKDIDLLGKVLLNVKDEVNKDHLQFSDPQYRQRRNQIAQIAMKFKHGDQIPEIKYTPQENQLWINIFTKLRNLHKNSMSQRFQLQMNRMEKYFKMYERIPQLNELSLYLQSQTGFRIKPVHGILSQREFLNCFAFKYFSSTQYLRHHKTPQYTPQPDIVHQIVGHVPLFADPQVADLSHKIGLLSLGASDQQIAKLGALYWYTLQFGACKQGDQVKGYGAGIASSFGQIQHFLSDKAKFKPFQPKVDCTAPYPVQTVQEMYRVTQSFEKSLQDLESFGRQILKPVSTTYNFVKKRIDYDRNIIGVPPVHIKIY